MGFDLTRLLVQVVERFLELPGRFGGAFGGLTVASEPGVQGPQSLAYAHDNQPDAGTDYGRLNGNHRGTGNSGHGRPSDRPRKLEPGESSRHGRFEPGKRGPESSHEGRERKPLDSVAQSGQLSPEGHRAGSSRLGIAHIHEQGRCRRCYDCFRTSKHRYQLPDAGDYGRNDGHDTGKGRAEAPGEGLHSRERFLQSHGNGLQDRRESLIDGLSQFGGHAIDILQHSAPATG